MLLTISTTHRPASDLSFLLHKHPAKVQQVEISAGVSHIFYPEVSEERCTIALLLDIDTVGLVRGKGGPAGNEFVLQQYVNDRPYVASSFMSAAIIKAFSTAMNGKCKEKPELVDVPMPFDVELAVLPVSGGEELLRQLFGPLGYQLECERHLVDPAFPEWGESRYFSVRLAHPGVVLQELLSHLYVLIPVCDNDKHYWVGSQEVGKLLEKGKEWLQKHPMRELIAARYLKHRTSLVNEALEVLLQGEEEEDKPTEVEEKKVRIHDQRLMAVRDEVLKSGAKTVVDLGCGEGKLLTLLLAERKVEKILGMDVSSRSLEIARDKLKLERMPPAQQKRIELIQGALTYRDRRLEGYDAAAMVEVIEHLDESRLAAMEQVIFRYARPGLVLVTTPNKEYNVLFENFEEGKMRHSDHRFEWTRSEFQEWGNRIGGSFGYAVEYRPVGEEDAKAGSISQMAIFTIMKHEKS